MARIREATWKRSRRLGFSILENGKELQKRPFPPGQHGKRRAKLSNYGLQLAEKQKVRFMYAVNEKQFRTTYDKSKKLDGPHGQNFLKLLESRLDNVVYRMGLAPTRRAARQIVNHGHICVNGKKVDIPSFIVKAGQEISVKENSRKHPVIMESLQNSNGTAEFVTFDAEKMTGTFVRLPERSELNQEINEQLIVEFYNK